MKTKKIATKIFALILCFAVVWPSMMDCQAMDYDYDGNVIRIEPRYIGTNDVYSSLTISSSGRATCLGSVSTDSGYTANVKMSLQQKNGTTWSTIKTWSDSGADVLLSGNYYVASGYDYRVKVSADVSIISTGSIIERPVAYSATVHY